jgi:hypothetical protein
MKTLTDIARRIVQGTMVARHSALQNHEAAVRANQYLSERAAEGALNASFYKLHRLTGARRWSDNSFFLNESELLQFLTDIKFKAASTSHIVYWPTERQLRYYATATHNAQELLLSLVDFVAQANAEQVRSFRVSHASAVVYRTEGNTVRIQGGSESGGYRRGVAEILMDEFESRSDPTEILHEAVEDVQSVRRQDSTVEIWLSGSVSKEDEREIIEALQDVLIEDNMLLMHARPPIYGSIYIKSVFEWSKRAFAEALPFSKKAYVNIRTAFDSTVNHSQIDATEKLSRILEKHEQAIIRVDQMIAIKVTRRGKARVLITQIPPELRDRLVANPALAHDIDAVFDLLQHGDQTPKRA